MRNANTTNKQCFKCQQVHLDQYVAIRDSILAGLDMICTQQRQCRRCRGVECNGLRQLRVHLDGPCPARQVVCPIKGCHIVVPLNELCLHLRQHHHAHPMIAQPDDMGQLTWAHPVAPGHLGSFEVLRQEQADTYCLWPFFLRTQSVCACSIALPGDKCTCPLNGFALYLKATRPDSEFEKEEATFMQLNVAALKTQPQQCTSWDQPGEQNLMFMNGIVYIEMVLTQRGCETHAHDPLRLMYEITIAELMHEDQTTQAPRELTALVWNGETHYPRSVTVGVQLKAEPVNRIQLQ